MQPDRHLSRRRLLGAAAWSAPVVFVGAAAPAVAQSPDFTEFTGIGCKYPGGSDIFDKGYAYSLITTNPSDRTLLVVVTGFTVAGVPAPDYCEILDPLGASCGTGLPVCIPSENPPLFQQNESSPSTICIPPAGPDGPSVVEWVAVAAEYNNSQNDSASITFDVYDISDGACTYLASGGDSTNPNDLPPCPRLEPQPLLSLVTL